MASKAESSTGTFINISAYKFVTLDNLSSRREELLDLCQSLNLKGTILLSHEGVNCFVAGLRDQIDQLVSFFESRPEYRDLPVKESESDEQPFSRMLVRVKKEIIAFGVEGVEPAKRTSPKLKPEQLKQWLDEGRSVTLLDVRNDYEVDLGTFDAAVPIGVDNFRDFPSAVEQLPEQMKDETIVMFCTGGIRCEKAGPFMEREGFQNVYQLDGGILKYFEDCGGEHYQGECFVFDKRVAVDAKLNETPTSQCYACQSPLSLEDQQSEKYVVGKSCSFCYQPEGEKMQAILRARNEQLQQVVLPLPGSEPYDNHRPLNVPLRFEGQAVANFLSNYHPHVERSYWVDEVTNGRILYKNKPVELSLEVWAGQRLVHLLKGTVEPDVSGAIELIYEDADLIVVNKPAPLPMHPCGRFNRNSLSYILNAVYSGEKIRMTHRLDANTTGVVVFARKRVAAQQVQSQFERSSVSKTYLARVVGKPEQSQFACEEKISTGPQQGGLRLIDNDKGHEACTRFKLIEQFADGTSLVECTPLTGRTNQIRLHLWSLGLPILNDPSYLPDHQVGNNQTLPINVPSMCLHAVKLVLEHPTTGQTLDLQAPAPDWASENNA